MAEAPAAPASPAQPAATALPSEPAAPAAQAAPAASSSTSLIAAETPDGDDGKPLQAHETVIAHRDTGAAEGTRPAWLPDNFWKDGKADYENLAKSYGELRAAYSQGKHKAPKDGKYDLAAFGDKVKADDPGVKMYNSWAQKFGVSQEAYNELAQNLVELAGTLDPAVDPQAYIAGEMKKLGQHGPSMVKGFADWGRGLIQKGLLSNDDWAEWQNLGGSAQGLRIMLKVREMLEGPLPINLGESGEGLPSKQELEQMVADPRYTKDPAFREKVERLFQKVYPDRRAA